MKFDVASFETLKTRILLTAKKSKGGPRKMLIFFANFESKIFLIKLDHLGLTSPFMTFIWDPYSKVEIQYTEKSWVRHRFGRLKNKVWTGFSAQNKVQSKRKIYFRYPQRKSKHFSTK